MRGERIVVDGAPVSWAQEGTGVPVVMVHGIPTSPALWRHVAADPCARRRDGDEEVSATARAGLDGAHPLRTTEEELAAYRDEGVLVTDTVAAALFGVATALGVRAGGAVVATTTVVTRRAGTHPAADPPARAAR